MSTTTAQDEMATGIALAIVRQARSQGGDEAARIESIARLLLGIAERLRRPGDGEVT